MKSSGGFQNDSSARPEGAATSAGGAATTPPRAGGPVASTGSTADPAATELLRRAVRGDRAAYGQLVVRYQDRLFNAMVRMVGDRDEAAELTQEAFTRGLANLAGFRAAAAPYTWIFRIAMNLAISRLRQVQRRRVFSLDRLPPSGESGRAARGQDQAAALVDRASRSRAAENSPAAVLERRERAEQVLAALGRLEPEQRAVLVMRDVEEFDYQQMADALEVPLGTLKSRLFRARIALRDQLKGYMS